MFATAVVLVATPALRTCVTTCPYVRQRGDAWSTAVTGSRCHAYQGRLYCMYDIGGA